MSSSSSKAPANLQCGVLLHADHMIEILNCLPRRALSEIVQTRNDDQTAARVVQREADVAEIGVRYVLQLRELARRPDADHFALGIKLAVERFNSIAGLRLVERDVNG
jgi:hypothetical protein